VAAAFLADRERSAAGRAADASPPSLPPLRLDAWLSAWPRPEPDFFPPPLSLFTVAHARPSAVFVLTPRFSYPSAMCSAFRFCLSVYFDFSPRGMMFPPDWKGDANELRGSKRHTATSRKGRTMVHQLQKPVE
jgi:hypothetical protein